MRRLGLRIQSMWTMVTNLLRKRRLTLRMRLALGYSAFFTLVLALLGTGVILTVRV